MRIRHVSWASPERDWWVKTSGRGAVRDTCEPVRGDTMTGAAGAAVGTMTTPHTFVNTLTESSV